MDDDFFRPGGGRALLGIVQVEHGAPPDDPTNPRHYADLRPEPIDVIEGWGLGFALGNVVKYVARAGRKGDALTDLRKARVYLERRIAQLEGKR